MDFKGRISNSRAGLRIKIARERIRCSRTNQDVTLAAQGRGIAVFDRCEFQQRKRSDRLFILGSGASVNTIPDDGWAHIGRHDSLGLNFWCLHPFVPTFYMFETPRDEARRVFFEASISIRESEYAKVLLLYREPQKRSIDSERLPSVLASNLRVPLRTTLFDGPEWQLRRQLRTISESKRWARSSKLLQFRASLTEAVSFGALLGYSEIVLLGVDLNHTRYFWEEFEEFSGFPSGQVGTVHRTADPIFGALTIDKVLACMAEELLAPKGIKLFTGSPESALAKVLPIYEGI